jgi:hypothetical protein
LSVRLSYERMRCCGCKSSVLFLFYNPFRNLFLKYFLKHWFVGFYKCDFLKICYFKGAVLKISSVLKVFGFIWDADKTDLIRENADETRILLWEWRKILTPALFQRRGRRDTKGFGGVYWWNFRDCFELEVRLLIWNCNKRSFIYYNTRRDFGVFLWDADKTDSLGDNAD